MSGTFACMTDRHDLALDNLPTCARELYTWLLRQTPAGKPVEIHLEDFRTHKQGRCRGRGYTLAWVKQSLKELIEVGLVEVAFKFSSKIFKLITWHPDRQDAADLKKTLQNAKETQKNFNKNRRIQPSNADSLAPLYREIRETTDKPTHHPVSTNEQEGAIDSPTTSKSPEPEMVSDRPQVNEPKVIHQIEKAGFKLNSTLITIVRTTAAEIVLDAIAATQQYLTRLERQNTPLKRRPEAVLVAAIQGQWHPQDTQPANGVSPMPDDFNEWFQLAREVGLVSISSAQSDLTGQLPGVLCVQTVSGNWEPFDQMRRLHPLDEVQESAKRKHAATRYVPSPRFSDRA
jgi:hypothetical protein